MKSFGIFFTFILILNALCLNSGAEGRKKVTVGIVLRLNDKYNNSVTALVRGIELAKLTFEEKHKNVEVVLKRYSHGEDLLSVIHATDLAIADKIPAIIGGELSEEAMVIGEQLAPHKIVLMSPTSSNPKVTIGRPFVFRGCFSDDQVAGKLASYVFNKLKPKSLGIVHNLSSPYTDFNAKLFLATYSKLTTSQANGNIEIAKVVKDTVDFSAVIQQFINKNVTHVVMLNHHADLLRFSTQAAARNYFPTYIGSDGWGSNENVFKTLVLDSTLGSHFVGLRNNYWHEESTTRAAAAFKAGFKKKFIERPDAWSAIGYDSMLLLLSAMNRASDPTNGDLIRKSMQETRNPPLATSETFTFDTNNSPKKDLYIYKIHKYGVKFEEIIK